MTARIGLKNELDPEELLKRKFRAKCLFRALGRLVIANAYWLIEGVDRYEGIDDIKRRVAHVVTRKTRRLQKQRFSMKDKALLNKKAEVRTDHEKRYIYRIIGGLKCFKRYPNHVKRRLAAATYFKYYGPGRVIVRQNHEAHALYFIISGDLTVSQQIFDDLLKQYVSVDIGTMKAGEMFGEVSLLHNIPRTATVTTNDHCELLTLMKEDFKNVLQASIQKQWDEVRHAMSGFTYFEGLDEVSRREGCIVAKMKTYEANETLLGDGVGVPNFVYFMLTGRCQMIESLQIIVTTRLGKNSFTLYDPYVPKEESDQDLDAKYFGSSQNLKKDSDATELNEQERAESTSKEGSCARERLENFWKRKKIPSIESRDESEIFNKESNNCDESKSAELLKPATSRLNRESVRMSALSDVTDTHKKLRTYFMQVCQLNAGSSFGFGENMRDRRIVALTPVSCMLLPKIWLLQRNTANIWTRIQYYLEKKIPNKKQLFEEFVSARRWQEFKGSLVEDVVSRANTVNWTSTHDVPYSIRMEEMLDI